MRKINRKSVISLMLCLTLLGSIFTGCSGEKEGTINIATKPVTEQLILGEMLAQLIENHTNLNVKITKNVAGGTGNIHPALLKGEFDLYPEYTGTAWLNVLKKKEIPDNQTLYQELQKEYLEKYNLRWLGLYGFNNTYALVVKENLAKSFHLETYSDLAAISNQLIFGSSYDFFEREDGYPALCKAYGFHFKDTADMEIGLKYQALDADQVNVINAFTTDAQLSSYPLKVLVDDKKFFHDYLCGTVIRQDTLDQYPQLEPVLMKMENIITAQEMSQLNAEVENEKRDEKEVAKEFLISKGLL